MYNVVESDENKQVMMIKGKMVNCLILSVPLPNST